MKKAVCVLGEVAWEFSKGHAVELYPQAIPEPLNPFAMGSRKPQSL